MAAEDHVIDNSLVQQISYLDEAGYSRYHAKDRHVEASSSCSCSSCCCFLLIVAPTLLQLTKLKLKQLRKREREGEMKNEYELCVCFFVSDDDCVVIMQLKGPRSCV